MGQSRPVARKEARSAPVQPKDERACVCEGHEAWGCTNARCRRGTGKSRIFGRERRTIAGDISMHKRLSVPLTTLSVGDTSW